MENLSNKSGRLSIGPPLKLDKSLPFSFSANNLTYQGGQYEPSPPIKLRNYMIQKLKNERRGISNPVEWLWEFLQKRLFSWPDQKQMSQWTKGSEILINDRFFGSKSNSGKNWLSAKFSEKVRWESLPTKTPWDHSSKLVPWSGFWARCSMGLHQLTDGSTWPEKRLMRFDLKEVFSSSWNDLILLFIWDFIIRAVYIWWCSLIVVEQFFSS